MANVLCQPLRRGPFSLPQGNALHNYERRTVKNTLQWLSLGACCPMAMPRSGDPKDDVMRVEREFVIIPFRSGGNGIYGVAFKRLIQWAPGEQELIPFLNEQRKLWPKFTVAPGYGAHKIRRRITKYDFRMYRSKSRWVERELAIKRMLINEQAQRTVPKGT